MEIIIIAAVAKNNVIGIDGKIPWHSREELQHFKKTTMSFPIIMGRKTFESIGKALPGRLNIVISRNNTFTTPDGVELVSNIDNALVLCKSQNVKKVFIIGGGEIYKNMFPIADKLIITKFDLSVEGDTYFPEISDKIWNETNIEKFQEFTVHTYEK